MKYYIFQDEFILTFKYYHYFCIENQHLSYEKNSN